MSQIQKSISLNENTWKQIDKQKGDITRSRFVAKIIADRLRESKQKV